MRSNFVDYVKICCRSGAGGAGSVHFHRDRKTSKGGPDGGDGGRGGHIILKGNKQLYTLLHLKYRKHVIAKKGENGSGARKHGADGKDVILEVPLGTFAKQENGDEILIEIKNHGEEKILLAGGRGGQGNDHFKSATMQTPRFAQPGEEGKTLWMILELRLLADVGLVGMPNAGKSTFLSVVSAARPEIADYPFTTLTPNLGVVRYKNDYSFVVADIPGLIKGASEGKGLGTRFLKHIEHNNVLLFFVPADADDYAKTFELLTNELQTHNPELLHKNAQLIITKADLLDEELKLAMRNQYKALKFMFISSVTGEGIDALKDKIWQLLHKTV